jgi:hypothetical protein
MLFEQDSALHQFGIEKVCRSRIIFIVLYHPLNSMTMTFLFLFGGGILLTLFLILFILILPLLALISVLTNEFRGNEKIMWVLIIIFLPFLGSVLYVLIGRDKRITR